MAWAYGDVIVRREVACGAPWEATPIYVVEDSPELLVTYLPEGAPIGYLPNSTHPWFPQASWYGHGVLMLQRPNESHAVWHFWEGPQRTFARWYVNLQEPFRRTSIGYDTQDLELDIVITPDQSWTFKDLDLIDQRVSEGRFTPSQATAIRREGDRIARELNAGQHWWDHHWTTWKPDPNWPTPALRDGWELIATLDDE